MSKLIKFYQLFSLNGNRIVFLSLCLLLSSFFLPKKEDRKFIKTVVIDPGHGGHDPGNLGTGRYNITEKHVVLDISLRLGEYIKKAFPEMKVLYTRKTNGDFMKLWERTEFANKNNADLFISIHCDAFHNSDAHGTSVFVMGMSKLKANMDIAMKENSVIYLEDDYKDKYEGFDPNSAESYIVFSLMQNTYLDQSLYIAEKIEQEFSNTETRRSRGVKQAPFYVISHANMPSILVEAGFLTNPEEEDFLHSEEGKEYIASAIFKAFNIYKEDIESVNTDNKDVNEILSDTIGDASIIFKIQIATSMTSLNFLDLDLEIEEQLVNDSYKYFVGEATSKYDADSLKNIMIHKGFQDAFIVAFLGGMQISVKEALDLQKNK